MLHTGDGISGRRERNDFGRIVGLILDRYPDATNAEITRGFEIACESIEQEVAEVMAADRS